jgi:hypothetical protein
MSIDFPIFVINMEKDFDRWESVQDQAREFSFYVERVAAIEARNVPKVELEFVTAGVRAVWKSHMKCMRLLLESEFSHAVIAEDDFCIEKPKLLFSTLKNKEILEYDVIQLGWITPGLDNRIKRKYADLEHLFFRTLYKVLIRAKPKSSNLGRLRVRSSGKTPKGFIPDDFQPGGQFYLISREFAKAILKLNEPQFLAADDLYIALARMRSLKFIRSTKNLVSQKPFKKWSGSRFSSH